MNETKIRYYAELMKELELTALEIGEGKNKLRLERAVNMPAPQMQPVQTIAVQEAPENTKVTDTADYISIKSPMVGVYYGGLDKGVQPFVSEGDRVQKGQVLCVIEAMKLMNEISAEENGILEKVCVQNGQLVEFGTELFRIRRQ